VSIQYALQQSNPTLHGAQPSTQKLKEKGALPYKVSSNGHIGTFETYQRTIKAWAVQLKMHYLFKNEFMEHYSKEVWHTTHAYARTGITKDQFKHDKEVLYGAIMASNKDNPTANKYISM